MPITIKTNQLRYKIPGSGATSYVGIGTIAEKTAAEFKAEIIETGMRVRNTIPNSYNQLSNDVNALKAGLSAIADGNGLYNFDTRQTRLLFSLSSTSLNLTSVWKLGNSGTTKIDWGDGSETTIQAETDMAHTYSAAGNYAVTLYGITAIDEDAFKNLSGLYKAYVGSLVATIGTNAFYGNTNGMELYLFGKHAKTITNINAFDSAGIIYVEDYINYLIEWQPMLNLSTADYATFIAKVFPIKQTETIVKDLLVTVGASGDFKTLNSALTYLSQFYPMYKKGGVSCTVKILANTTISEQIYVRQQDLQFITIIAEDTYVPVDGSGFTWTADEHDSRESYPFIAGENAAKLPTIGCVFRLTVPSSSQDYGVSGLLCNRGSECVVLANSGFEYFTDGVISNNESTVTIREGISRHNTRWGLHARHNGEISARSADLSENGLGAYADRLADLDVRKAIFDGCMQCILCRHVSRICANSGGTATAIGCGDGTQYLVDVREGGVVDIVGMNFSNSLSSIISISDGGTVIAHNIITTGLASGKQIYSNNLLNNVSSDGIIYAVSH